MQKYIYTAFDGHGRKTAGEIAASSQSEAFEALKASGLNPSEVRDAGGSTETAAVAAEQGQLVPGFNYDARYYRKQQGRQLMTILVSIAMIGLAVYGAHILETDFKTTSIILSVPALWLALSGWSYLRYGQLAGKAE